MLTKAVRRSRCSSVWFLVSLALLFGAVCGANASDSAEDFWGFGPIVAQFTVVDCPWDLDLQQPSRVVMQVIDNVFHKWHEYDIGDSVEICIVLHAPEQRKLTAPEAQALLEASSQWVTQVPDPSEGYTLYSEDPRLDLPLAMPPHPEAMGPPAMIDDKPDVKASPSSTFPLKIGREDPVSVTSRDLLPLSVIGDDERVRIPQSTVEQYPVNTIGYVGNEFPNDTRWRGTGFLVTPYMILTNGHVVYNASRGGFITELEFAPAQYQASEGAIVERPYGSRQAVTWETNQPYVDTGQTEYDYAAAFFDTTFSDITTFMPLEFDYSPSYINTAGYPGTAQGESTRSMWFESGDAWVDSSNGRVLRHVADTSGGQSGSPVWVYSSATGLRRVVAVHSFGGTTSNGGPRLVWQNQSLIEDWMQRTPTTDTTRPTCNLSINNGASTTTSLTVTLYPNGADSGGSGLSQMRFSNNNSTWSSWEAYSSTKSSWDLSSYGGNTNAGTKTSYCEVKDGAGNIVSSPCSDSIIYNPPDTTAPTPDPMTWSSAPSMTGATTISMTATTATDPSGVEYSFEETSGSPGGDSSGWQDSATYTDTGLQVSTEYCYQVKARDKSANQNETGWSNASCATSAPAATSAVFRVDDAGNVLADEAFYGASFQTGSADVAEWVAVSEPVEPGAILELDPDKPAMYRQSEGRCSTLVGGVVSTKPGVTLGHEIENVYEGNALLALIGIVPVKVTNEGGPIRPGDLLVTSSTPGHAMRWAGPGPCLCSLVGKALEPMDDEQGVILVLLTAH